MNKFVFFGSADFSVRVLHELAAKGVLPSLVVTTPDKPKGRKLILTPNVVKTWAEEKGIECIDPKSLKKPASAGGDAESVVERLKEENADFFLVAAYGKIIPATIFDIPKFKTINIHPSLLPKYRGASPMISQILNDEKEIGTSIMVIDEGMDTGGVFAQKKVEMENWPVSAPEMERTMSKESVTLFLEVIPKYLSGELKPVPQNNAEATECGKVEKEDGLLDLEGDPRKNLLKIKAFSVWPRAYFMLDGKRMIVTDATLEDGKLKLLRVIPEGKKEMSYDDFLRGLK